MSNARKKVRLFLKGMGSVMDLRGASFKKHLDDVEIEDKDIADYYGEVGELMWQATFDVKKVIESGKYVEEK